MCECMYCGEEIPEPVNGETAYASCYECWAEAEGGQELCPACGSPAPDGADLCDHCEAVADAAECGVCGGSRNFCRCV